jgi:hypothetical protein
LKSPDAPIKLIGEAKTLMLQAQAMKGRAFGIWLAWLVLLPANALGDGGFFPATAFERVQIPDQRALIHFADGKETLVIDTAFKGGGTNFAWIIPVPSLPTVETATTGLFSTLQIIFQPRIVHDVLRFYRFVIFVGFLMAYGLWKVRRGESPVGMLMVVALLAILASLLLPALGTSSTNTFSGVNVIERKRVGVYETATLLSRDGEAVFHWLKQNGFVAPTNSVPAIRTYAQEGWYFVASKIRMDASLPDGAKPQPLTLIFTTDRPVYPLRLTGVNNESCRIELYVFGPSRAELPHFKVERCAAPSYPDSSASSNWRLKELRIRHPLLRRLVDGSPVATKLVGQLSHHQMQDDAYVVWTPLKEKRLTRYSGHGAAVVAANFTLPLLMVGMLGLLGSCWVREGEPIRAKQMSRVSGVIVLTAVAGWGIIYVCLPKTRVVVSRMPAIRMSGLHRYVIPKALERQGAGRVAAEGGKPKLNAGWVRQQLAETSDFRKGLGNSSQTNLISGELWREEDSPGNYTIRETPAGVDYVWYDIEGAENVVPLCREEETK